MNKNNDKKPNRLNKKGQAIMSWWFALLWYFFWPIFFILFRTKYNDKKNATNSEGGLITICNHVSYRDIIIMVLGLRRKIKLLAKDELFKNPIIGAFFKAIGAIPVSRDGSGNDMYAVRAAIKAAKGGEAVLLFPEGTRSKNGELLPFEKGAAYIAMACKVNVIPCYISPKRIKGRIAFDFGEPIDIVELSEQFEKKERLENVNNELRNAVIKQGEIQRARYGLEK